MNGVFPLGLREVHVPSQTNERICVPSTCWVLSCTMSVPFWASIARSQIPLCWSCARVSILSIASFHVRLPPSQCAMACCDGRGIANADIMCTPLYEYMTLLCALWSSMVTSTTPELMYVVFQADYVSRLNCLVRWFGLLRKRVRRWFYSYSTMILMICIFLLFLFSNIMKNDFSDIGKRFVAGMVAVGINPFRITQSNFSLLTSI